MELLVLMYFMLIKTPIGSSWMLSKGFLWDLLQ